MPLYLHRCTGGCAFVQAPSKSAARFKLGLPDRFPNSRIVPVPEFKLQFLRGEQGKLEFLGFGRETARFLKEAGYSLHASHEEFPEDPKDRQDWLMDLLEVKSKEAWRNRQQNTPCIPEVNS